MTLGLVCILCVYACVPMGVCMYMYVCVCVYACVWDVCVCVCVHVCMRYAHTLYYCGMLRY